MNPTTITGPNGQTTALTPGTTPVSLNAGYTTNLPGVPTNSPAIVTSQEPWTQFNNATSELNTVVGTPDPYTQLFQQQREANALTADNAIASASAAEQRNKIALEERKNATIAGLETAAAKTGLAPNSAYQLQVIEGAQNQFQNRFMLLDQTEKLAIAKAKAAQAQGDIGVLKEQLDYVRQLRKEKADALNEANKMAWEKYKFEHLSAAQRASEARLGAAKETKLPKPAMVAKALDLGTDTKVAAELEAAGLATNDIIGIQDYLAKGYSLKQIATITGMPAEIYNALLPHITGR